MALSKEPKKIQLKTWPDVFVGEIPKETEDSEGGGENTEDVADDQFLVEFQNNWELKTM